MTKTRLVVNKNLFYQEKAEKPAKARLVVGKNKVQDENELAPVPKRSRHTLGDRNFDGDNDLSFSTTPRRNDAVNQLLNRPQVQVQRPVS